MTAVAAKARRHPYFQPFKPMKLTIAILITLNVILSFLQAMPPQHGHQGQGGHQGHQGHRGHPGHGMQHPPVPPLWIIIDTNQDGTLSAEEIANAAESIGKLDTNGDGVISLTELPPPPHSQQGHGGQQGRPQHGGGQEGGQQGQSGHRGPSATPTQPQAPSQNPYQDYYSY